MDDFRSRMNEQLELVQEQLQALQQHVSALQNIVQIDSLLSPKLDFEDTLDSIQQYLSDHFQFSAYSLLLRMGREKELSLQSHFGFDAPSNFKFIFDDPNSIYYYVAEELRPLYLADLSHITTFKLDDCVGPPQGSLLSLPLIADDNRLIGIFNVKREKIKAFTDQEISILTDLSNQLATVIHKTLLFQTTKELAYTDSLTKVFNRRYFDQRFSREVVRAKRYNRVLSILMIDIDHFKIYNDTSGHLMGDAALRSIAQIFEDNLRRADVLCRYGGEEFVVILPEIHQNQAILVAEKLRTTVLQASFPGEDKLPDHRLTISIGVACLPQDGETPASLLKAADEFLYKAKESGRNTVISKEVKMS